jgi:hypothetical protein
MQPKGRSTAKASKYENELHVGDCCLQLYLLWQSKVSVSAEMVGVLPALDAEGYR